MKRPKTTDVIYNGDRWRVPGEKGVYIVFGRNFNGVGHWEFYRAASPKAKPEFLFYGIDAKFAVIFKDFYNTHGLKKIRTPKKDRIGPSLMLWGLLPR